MSTITLATYLIGLASVLVGTASLIAIFYGLMNKKKKSIIVGGIFTFFAVIMFVTTVFLGTKHFLHFVKQHNQNQEKPSHDWSQYSRCQKGDTIMFIKNMKEGCCMDSKKKCDTTLNKSKCPYKK